jgi:hypothetical protein
MRIGNSGTVMVSIGAPVEVFLQLALHKIGERVQQLIDIFPSEAMINVLDEALKLLNFR